MLAQQDPERLRREGFDTWLSPSAEKLAINLQHGTSKCFILYLYYIIYMGGHTCGDTPIYYI